MDNISHVPISTEHEHVNNQLPVSGVDVVNNAPNNNYAYHSNYPVPPAVNYIPTINYQDSYYQQTPAPLYHGMQYINSTPNINIDILYMRENKNNLNEPNIHIYQTGVHDVPLSGEVGKGVRQNKFKLCVQMEQKQTISIIISGIPTVSCFEFRYCIIK